MTLLYVPSPLPDESAASMLLRASYNNGYKSLSSFLNAYGFPVHTKSLNSMLADPEKFQEIIEKLGICKNSIYQIPAIYGPTKASQRIWHNKPISYNFFCADGTKLCTECLKEFGILKKEWLLKHLSCCTIHKKELITICSNCGYKITANRKKIDECYNCKISFINLIVPKANTLELYANDWFSKTLSSNDIQLIKKIKIFLSAIHSTQKTFKEFKINESPILLTYLLFTDKEKAEKIFLNIINNNNFIAHPKLLLFHFLSCNQSEIHEFMSNLFNNNKFNLCDFNNLKFDFSLTKRTTSILINFNRAKLDDKYFSFLKFKNKFSAKKINDFLLGKIKPIEKSYNKSINYITLKEAAPILGICYSSTVQLFSNNILIKKIPVYINNKRLYVFNKDDFLNFNHNYITVHRLATDLNVPTQYLAAKLYSIGIYPCHGPFIDDIKIHLYNRNHILHLNKFTIESIKYFNSKPTKKFKIKRKYNNDIDRASKILKISSRNLNKLIKFKILKTKKLASSKIIKISNPSLYRINKILNSGNYIHLKNVASFLQCPANWLRKYWIDTEFLKIIDLKIGKFVNKDDLIKIKELKNNYFTGAEASKHLNMPHQHITNLVKRGIIAPYYLGSRKRIRLFLKVDVYALKNKYSA